MVEIKIKNFILVGLLYLGVISNAQEISREDLFSSIDEQKVELLQEYLDSDGDLGILSDQGNSLLYHSIENWNLPAAGLLLNNNAPFQHRRIKSIIREKVKNREEISISEENYFAHNKVTNYIEPFESYNVVDARQKLEAFTPTLSPPSYSELKQIFNKAKPQFELIVFKNVISGFGNELSETGLSAGGGILLPLFKRYSVEVKAGEKNIRLSKTNEGNTIYLDNEVFQVDQLEMQQKIKQKFSLYLSLTFLYGQRKAGMLPENPDFFSTITTEDYVLDIRSLDITPSLFFKYGAFYVKTGIEFRSNLETSILWNENQVGGKNSELTITENIRPFSNSIVITAGFDIQFAYIEIGRSFASTNLFENIASEVNWLGISIGLRF